MLTGYANGRICPMPRMVYKQAMHIGPLPAFEAREIQRLATKHGCTVALSAVGKWWWKRWTLDISGPQHNLKAFENDLNDLQEDWTWFHAIK